MLGALAAVLATVLGVSWIAARDSGGAGAEALRRYPPIALVWAPVDWADSTASGDLYVLRPGTGIRRVKALKPRVLRDREQVQGAYDARWSPDRKRIALTLFVWDGDPYGQVGVVSSHGGQVRKLSLSSYVGNVAWAPDGRALAYSYLGDLRTVALQGGKATRIFHVRGYDAGGYGIDGTDWAPDGRNLAVGGLAGIVKISRNGANVVKLTKGSAPEWSPDGRTIAFTRGPTFAGDGIYVIGGNGRAVRRLVSDASASSPQWSPDGRSILFTTERGIRVVAADGHSDRALTSDRSDVAVGWSPDGSKILFLRDARCEHRPHRWTELWLMDADGSAQTRLPFNRTGWSVVSADWGR